MNRVNFSIFLLFSVLVALLLLGQRLGFEFAGGNGYEPSLRVSTAAFHGTEGESDPVRGSVIATDAQSWILYDIDGTKIGMYENTVMELKKLTAERIEITVPKGRVMIDNTNHPERKVTVRSNTVEATSIGGRLSFVNYDFQWRVSVIPMGSHVSVIYAEDQATITETPVDISELPPYDLTDTEFDPSSSSAADFYEWFDISARL